MTSVIPWNASAATVTLALQALPTVSRVHVLRTNITQGQMIWYALPNVFPAFLPSSQCAWPHFFSFELRSPLPIQ